jgi:hypothetical protein
VADAVGYGESTGMRLDMVTGGTIFKSARWLSMRDVGVGSRFLEACGDLVKFDGGQFMRSRHTSALTYRRTSFRAKVGIGYDVSEKHFETNRQAISAGLRLSMTIIGVRQVGHSRDELLAASSARTTGVICNNRRQTSRRADRWEFAMKPKCRIRTKPFGSTCRRHRRANSSAETVIFFVCCHQRNPAIGRRREWMLWMGFTRDWSFFPAS